MTSSFLGPDPLEQQIETVLGRIAAGEPPSAVEIAQVDVKEEKGRRGRGGIIIEGATENEAAAPYLCAEMACDEDPCRILNVAMTGEVDRSFSNCETILVFEKGLPMSEPVFVVGAYYRDPKAALAWLEEAFGFETTMAIDGPDGDPTSCHYEMSYEGRGRIMVGGEWAEWAKSPASLGGANTQSMHVELPSDIGAHCERARAAGAVIAAEPEDQFYGDRTYRAVDPEGHVWTFSMHVRDVTRADAEQTGGVKIEAQNWA